MRSSKTQNILSIAEHLKTNLCDQIDTAFQTLIKDKEELDKINSLFVNNEVSTHECIKSLIQENQELKNQKDYIPLIQQILRISKRRQDNLLINTIDEFLISGRLI